MKTIQDIPFHSKAKVIFENEYLPTDDLKIELCRICSKVRADFVKTSTGFSSGGAKVEDVALMRKTVGAGFGVKASGGIRDAQKALAMINAGATRIGTSAGIAIVRGLTER